MYLAPGQESLEFWTDDISCDSLARSDVKEHVGCGIEVVDLRAELPQLDHTIRFGKDSSCVQRRPDATRMSRQANDRPRVISSATGRRVLTVPGTRRTSGL
jgi:hypothetical protein